MNTKTNVMRILQAGGVKYQSHEYPSDKALSGIEVANLLSQSLDTVFKTLVTVGKSKNHYVFIVPVATELNLKKAAQASGEKSIEMLKSKDLFALTGYVHGGCSPIGMKKEFKTFIDSSALEKKTIVFSAGKIGYQVELPLSELQKIKPIIACPLV